MVLFVGVTQMSTKSFQQPTAPTVFFNQVSTRSGPVLEFTAPADGMVMFVTHEGMKPATSQTVSVLINAVTVLSFLQAEVEFGQSQSSCIAPVHEGDEVQLMVDTVTNTDGNTYLHRAGAFYI